MQQTGEVLGVEVRTVRRLCLSGELVLVYAGSKPTSSPRVTAESVARFIERRVRRPGPRAVGRVVEQHDPWMVVIDSLRSAADFDENDSGQAATLMRRIAGIAAARLVVPVHHEGVNGRMRGSTHLAAAADGTVHLDRKASAVTLDVKSHDAADLTLTIRMVRDDVALRFEEVRGASVEDEDEQRNRRALRDALGEPRSTSGAIREARRIAKERGWKLGRDSALRASLEAMAAEGLLVEEGEGRDHRWRRASAAEERPA